MATLVLRTVKGSPLTNAEVDGNFSNINNEVGVVANLTTTNKSNLVFAVNEVRASLTTANVAEVTNLYFTNTRARDSISVAGAATYSNTTGVITVTGGVTSVGGATGAVSNAQVVASFVAQLPPGTTGNVLTSSGGEWVSLRATPQIVNDNSSSVSYYLGMANATSSAWDLAYVSSSKLYFTPSTGTLNATVYNSLSDINQKENIINVIDASSVINQINGVEFTWKESGKKSAGVIAQEIEAVLPHLVETNKDGLKSVNYSGIIAYLIECNKELLNRIEKLEKQ